MHGVWSDSLLPVCPTVLGSTRLPIGLSAPRACSEHVEVVPRPPRPDLLETATLARNHLGSLCLSQCHATNQGAVAACEKIILRDTTSVLHVL